MDGSDCCVICADELTFCGVGPCGHTEACSRCVARLRFVQQDKRCPLCQQESQQVYFTRAMGDFTNRIAPEEYPRMKMRADRSELYYVPEVEGFFDDQAHFKEIKALCGYTHPTIDCQAPGGKPVPNFKNLLAMKAYIEKNYKQSFCDVCLTGRQVFLCEQILYNKGDLEKHHRIGDASGPMSAENGFRGHPNCKFCKKRFYDSGELFRHMESAHEHCFICRRAAPDKYVYYRHYEELEDHFRKDHHMCPHPECLAKKFVVFPSEADFRRHIASEHGGDMSKAQKRDLLNIPVQLNYREREQAQSNELSEQDMRLVQMMQERSGVVIGGGHGVAARHAPRGGRAAGGGAGGGGSSGSVALRHAASETQLAQAEESVSSITFTAEDFPTVNSVHGGGRSLAPVGTWGGAPGTSGRSLNANNFPALPSKAPKKTGAGTQFSTIAQKMAASSKPVRVLNKAGPGSSAGPSLGSGSNRNHHNNNNDDDYEYYAPSSTRSAIDKFQYVPSGVVSSGMGGIVLAQAAPREAPTPSQAAPPTADAEAFPSLPAAGPKQPKHSMASAKLNLSSRNAAAVLTSAKPFSTPMTTSAAAAAAPPPQNVPGADDFPSLPAQSPGKRKGAKKDSAASSLAQPSTRTNSSTAPSSTSATSSSSFRPTSAPPAAADLSDPGLTSRYAEAFSRASSKNQAAAAAASGPAPVVVRPDDFPSLGQVAVATASSSASKAAVSAAAKQGGKKGKGGAAAAAAAAATSPNPSSSNVAAPSRAAAISSTRVGGVSEQLKAANKALIEKIKAKLTENQFAAFKKQSGEFMQGNIHAEVYHTVMVDLGLLSLTAELAALCPLEDRRLSLLEAHKSYLLSPAAQDVSRPGWVPPEAAIAAATKAEEQASWACSMCTLVNAPHLVVCEACNTMRIGVKPPVDDFPSLGAARGNGASSSAGQLRPSTADSPGKPKGKSKGVKVFTMPGPGTGRSQRSEWPEAAAPKAAWG